MPTILTRPTLRTHTFSVISTGISFSSYQSQLFQLYNNYTLSLLLNGVLSLTVYFFKFWLYRNIPICMQCFLLSFFFLNFDLLLHVCNILWTYSPWAFPSLLPSHSCLPFYNADPPSLVITSLFHPQTNASSSPSQQNSQKYCLQSLSHVLSIPKSTQSCSDLHHSTKSAVSISGGHTAGCVCSQSPCSLACQ